MIKIKIKIKGVNVDFIYIPCKTFFIGSYLTKKDNFPMVKVKVNGFFLAEVAVTQELFYNVMNFNPSLFKGKNLPVTNVSYYDAIQFCKRLNKIHPNYIFRLPSEAEWELAASAGRHTKFSGSDILDKVGWYNLNSDNHLKPVKQKLPNSYGFYDMSGNVWEWCEDWYKREYCKYGWPISGIINNPRGPTRGKKKVVRGGCFLFYDYVCGINQRSRRPPTGKCSYVGFRLALEKKI